MSGLTLTTVGEEYRILAGMASLRFRSIASHHDGATAIVEALDVCVGGRPHVDKLSLLSSRSRSSLAKTLTARWPDHPWATILDDACHAVDQALTVGHPARALEAIEPSPSSTDLVEGLIPLGQTTVLYADGGSLKSYFALALAVAAIRNEPLVDAARWCVLSCPSVLYLDWETDYDTHALRLWRLCQGLRITPPKGIHYLSFTDTPLHAVSQYIASEAHRLDAQLVIVDSLGMACGDEPESAFANLRTLGALRKLKGVTKLVLAHVSHATASTSGPGRPYGSVYVRNTARSTIEARSEAEPHGATVTYYHRKQNDSAAMPPSAIRYTFQPGGTLTLELASPDLSHAPATDRILAILSRRPLGLTAIELSAELNETSDAIRQALHRLRGRGKVVQIPGSAEKSRRWALASEREPGDET